MVSLNFRKIGDKTLLAACDKELLGKKFSEGELSLQVKEDFYKGEIVELETFAEKLKQANIVNLVGDQVVNKAIELGLVDSDSIIKIKNTPHVQIVKI